MALTNPRTDTSWRQAAACRGLATDIFFPLTDEEAGEANAICATCPVREECLEFALATRFGKQPLSRAEALERTRSPQAQTSLDPQSAPA